MQIVYSDPELQHYMRFAVEASPERPVLVDKFLEDATEVDVDCIADVGRFEDPAQGCALVGGMLEHIEFAGVHSGDAAMVLPPHSLSPKVIQTIREYTHALARELRVIGLMNVQYAVKGDLVYVLEVNPTRLAHGAVRLQGDRGAAGEAGVAAHGGENARGARLHRGAAADCVFVKEPVFPFNRFHGDDPLLGPEMRSTGEVMGMRASTSATPSPRRCSAPAWRCRRGGTAFLSVARPRQAGAAPAAKGLAGLGFELVATAGTAEYLAAQGLRCRRVHKVAEARPHVVDHLINGDIALVINTPLGREPSTTTCDPHDGPAPKTSPASPPSPAPWPPSRASRALREHGLEVRSLQRIAEDSLRANGAIDGAMGSLPPAVATLPARDDGAA